MSLRSVNEIQMEIRGKLAARPAKLPIYHLRPREKEKESHILSACLPPAHRLLFSCIRKHFEMESFHI